MLLVTLKKIVSNPNYAKVFEWVRLLSITGGAQAFVQGVGLLCGILVVRLLSTQEYAFYTIANTMLGTMTVLADSGIAKGVMAIGGKVWQDKKQLGDVITTGFAMRKRFAIASLLVATPILIYLLIHQGASWLVTLLVVLSLIPAFTSALSDTLLEITPKLHQDIYSLQKNQLQVAVLRLALSALMVFIFPFASIAILCSGIPRTWGNFRLKKVAAKFVENGSFSRKVQEEIAITVKRVMPSAIFYCLTGQITIWIISLSGNATSVAEIGALGRITVVFTLFNTVFATLIVPRYARLTNDRSLLVRSYFQIILGIIIVLIIFCLLTFFFSHQLLAIIGNNYSSLNSELFLYVIAASLSLLSIIHASLAASRGWFMKPVINVSFELAMLISGIFLFDLSSLRGVIFYNIYLSTTYLLQYIIYFIYCLGKKTTTLVNA